jgi:hypothetical protein
LIAGKKAAETTIRKSYSWKSAVDVLNGTDGVAVQLNRSVPTIHRPMQTEG